MDHVIMLQMKKIYFPLNYIKEVQIASLITSLQNFKYYQFEFEFHAQRNCVSC